MKLPWWVIRTVDAVSEGPGTSGALAIDTDVADARASLASAAGACAAYAGKTGIGGQACRRRTPRARRVGIQPVFRGAVGNEGGKDEGKKRGSHE
jgi:hypothetical protein